MTAVFICVWTVFISDQINCYKGYHTEFWKLSGAALPLLMERGSWLGRAFPSARYVLWVAVPVSPLGYRCGVCVSPSASADLVFVLRSQNCFIFLSSSVFCYVMLFLTRCQYFRGQKIRAFTRCSLKFPT